MFLLISYKPLVVGLLKPFKFTFIITLFCSQHFFVLAFLPEIDLVCSYHTSTFIYPYLNFPHSYPLLPFPPFFYTSLFTVHTPITYIFATLHSVQIYDRNIDNIVTLYCLRHASGCLADYIQYTCYIGPPDNIRYVLPLCPINSVTSARTPPSYIQYPMECDRRTMSDNDDIK